MMNRKNIPLGVIALLLFVATVKSATTAIKKYKPGEKGVLVAALPCPHPKTYNDSIASFNSQPVITGRIIFLGNSITQRGKWPEYFHDPTIINRGIGGDATCGILDRLDDVIKRKPSKLFILIGINDMQNQLNKGATKVDTGSILQNYRAILQRLRTETPDTKIHVESLLPTNAQKRLNWNKGKPVAFSEALNAGVRMLNPALKKVAEGYGCTWVNLYDWFKDGNNELIENYTDDGIHPNEAGYKHFVAYLKCKSYL